MRNLIDMVWSAARAHALDLVFSSECLACQAELTDDRHGVPLCDDCLAEIPPMDWPACRRCAAEVPDYQASASSCSRCDADKVFFDATICLGHYDGLLRELILRMKTDRIEQWGQLFTRLIVDRCGDALREQPFDAIVPIPMTPWHRWARGTNGPAVMARSLARLLNVPVFGRLVRRTYDILPQRGLSRAGRFRNVRGGYLVRKGYQLDAPHVLLVDDVMTTGATCSEVARILKRRGARRVTVLVVARTPNN